MPKITYIVWDGTERTVEVENGLSLMKGATMNDLPGITADCGGVCSCGTCHVYIDASWRSRTGERSEDEADMLGFAENVTDDSRLSCQIEVTDDLDGLVVRLPQPQERV